jgi:hypothetical protein
MTTIDFSKIYASIIKNIDADTLRNITTGHLKILFLLVKLDVIGRD